PEALSVSLVQPLPEVVPPAGLADGDERGDESEVVLAPVARDIEAPAHDVSDAPLDFAASDGQLLGNEPRVVHVLAVARQVSDCGHDRTLVHVRRGATPGCARVRAEVCKN